MASSGSNSYRDLVVWQEAMELVHGVYDLTDLYPDNEKFGLTSQTRRAAVSVACNIAEGQGRNSRNDFLHFLGTARGSLQEVETLLLVAKRRKYALAQAAERLMQQCDKVRRLLNGLMNSLRDSAAGAGQ